MKNLFTLVLFCCSCLLFSQVDHTRITEMMKKTEKESVLKDTLNYNQEYIKAYNKGVEDAIKESSVYAERVYNYKSSVFFLGNNYNLGMITNQLPPKVPKGFNHQGYIDGFINTNTNICKNFSENMDNNYSIFGWFLICMSFYYLFNLGLYN